MLNPRLLYCTRSKVAHKPEAQATDRPSLALQARVSVLTALSITAAVVGSLIGLALSLNAQPAVLRPTVFAVRDARIIPEAGKVLPRANVVIRDGVIEAVGVDATIPADALIIDGKGLTVYPGFIDGLSTWGFDPALRRSEDGPPGPEDFASEALAATQPDNRKGMTPEFAVNTALKADEERAEAWRKLGFTAHLIAPEGGTLTGKSALVSLSAAPPREAVLRWPVALHADFRPVAGPEYPRALMGVIAHCRQTLLDAAYYRREWAEFQKGGATGARPPLDSSLAALGDVLDGKIPVIFEADTKDSIHRCLDFAEEFHLRPIIYGGSDAWKVVDRLKAARVPVIVRLNLPEEPQARLAKRTSRPSMKPAVRRPAKRPFSLAVSRKT